MGAVAGKSKRNPEQNEKFLNWAKEKMLKRATIKLLLAADFDSFDALVAASEEDFNTLPAISAGQRVMLRKAISELRANKMLLNSILEDRNTDSEKNTNAEYNFPRRSRMGEGQRWSEKADYQTSSPLTMRKDFKRNFMYTSLIRDTVSGEDIYEDDIVTDRSALRKGTTVLKALYSHNSSEVYDELNFKAGDRFLFLDTDGLWLYAQHMDSGEKGYIPSNFVVPEGDELRSKDWWFDINRHEAMEHLLMPGLRDGTFCVRGSSINNTMALSVRCFKSKPNHATGIYHYKIYAKKESCYIIERKPFENVEMLIEYYKENRGLCCVLQNACPRIPETVPFKEMEVERKDIDTFEQLGEGNFGKVYKGKWRGDRDVAVKMLKPDTMEKSQFLEEARVMHRLRHRKLVQFMGVVSKVEPFLIITEFMASGCLKDYLLEHGPSKINFSTLIDIASQITDGMAFLEKHKFIHRDLRAANILVGENTVVKIGDFGLARLIDEFYVASGKRIPVKWTSPESLMTSKYTTKSDVWSFGVLMFEIITYGETPYAGMKNETVKRMVQSQRRIPKPTKYICPDDIYKQMAHCWHSEPSERPCFADLHVFFTKYRIKRSDLPPGAYYNEPGVVDDDESDEDFEGYVAMDYDKWPKKMETSPPSPTASDDIYDGSYAEVYA